jgi:alpha-L-rhamnosidase
MIDRGATTIWETWKESDNIYSNCHPMFGSVSEWFYRWLAGIRPDPAFPGFKKFIISPYLPDDLTFVKCVYESPFGVIISNWSKTGNGVKFEITVPANTTATFIVPVDNETKVTIEDINKRGETTKQVRKNESALQLKEGSYLIEY